MSEIKKYYAGKNILITGSTGFIGKVLLEKLVRECDEIKTVYLIVRNQNNFQKRCTDFLKHVVFERIQRERPELLQKIKFFDGDLRSESLGLNADQLHEIYNNVNIILHNGASVRFDMGIREAVNTNTMGAYRLLEIAKRIKYLEVFVFVSTAYSQINEKVIKEEHYDAIIDPNTAMKAVNRFDEATLDILQAKILDYFPNTYIFSKHLTEDLMHQYRNDLPICIVRPSVVSCAIQDPIENFAEGLNGYFGFAVAVLRGVFRIVCVNPKVKQSLVPVDTVANTVIATSWLHGSKRIQEAKYYNTSLPLSSLRPFDEICASYPKFRLELPLNFAVWIPHVRLTQYKFSYYFQLLVLQLMPSFFLDLLIMLFGQKPIMMKVQRKIFCSLIILMPFLQQFYFDMDNYLDIKKHLNLIDNEIFDTNSERTDFMVYIKNNIRGLKKFILLEKDEDLPKARRLAKILYAVDLIVRWVFYYFIVKFIWNRLFAT